ncbi:hypothetical protein ACIHIX_45930 [Streptomyces sp. NPDC051913]|uniref:hypothetical protein n=1 Tax=Streptomyces sp. NPDC051913 TaxID=3365676 RepID=UPI0037D7DBCE
MNSNLAQRNRVFIVLGGLVLIALCGAVTTAETPTHAQHTAVVRAEGSDGGSVDTTDPWS